MYGSMNEAAGAADCGEALPAHSAACVCMKSITLWNLDFFIWASCIHSCCVRCVQGHVDFWFPPQCGIYFQALSEGHNQIHPNQRAIVDLFVHLVPPDSLSPRQHLSSFVRPGLMRLSGHTCALRKIPLLSLKRTIEHKAMTASMSKAHPRLEMVMIKLHWRRYMYNSLCGRPTFICYRYRHYIWSPPYSVRLLRMSNMLCLMEA